MVQPIRIRRTRLTLARPSEEGFTLLAVMFLMAILAVWLAVAVPKMTKSIQRDRDQETIRRGKQYVRAIQLYYHKFHAYPPNTDALVQTNEIRFLRRRYVDPETGKDDWKPILFGQNQTPMAMGFFGQTLTGANTLAGIGPSGANGGLQGSPNPIGNPGQTGTFGSIFNSQQATAPSTPTTGAGQSDTSQTGTDGSDGGSGTTGAGSTGTTGSGVTANGANANPFSSGAGSAGPTNGQTFGGAGICGFAPASTKQSIVVYKRKNHYNEWEFTFDPSMEMMNAMGGVGAAGSGTNTSGLGVGTASSPVQPGGPGTGTTTPPPCETFSANGTLAPVGAPGCNNDN